MFSQTQSLIAGIVLLNLIGQLAPGPDVLLIGRTALTASRPAAFKTVLGIFTGVVFWMVLTVTGYANLLKLYPHLQNSLMAAGGAYLLYCGIGMLRATAPAEDADIGAAPVKQHYYRRGLMTNLANPKIVLYFGSVLSVALGDVSDPLLKYEIMVLLLVQIFLTFCLMIWLFSVPALKKRHSRYSRIADKTAGVLFSAFGLGLMIQAARGLFGF